MTKEGFKEIGGCPVCGEVTHLYYLKESYKIDVIDSICAECNREVSEFADIDNYKPKKPWQITKCKAKILMMKANYQECKEKIKKRKSFIQWIKDLITGKKLP